MIPKRQITNIYFTLWPPSEELRNDLPSGKQYFIHHIITFVILGRMLDISQNYPWVFYSKVPDFSLWILKEIWIKSLDPSAWLLTMLTALQMLITLSQGVWGNSSLCQGPYWSADIIQGPILKYYIVDLVLLHREKSNNILKHWIFLTKLYMFLNSEHSCSCLEQCASEFRWMWLGIGEMFKAQTRGNN